MLTVNFKSFGQIATFLGFLIFSFNSFAWNHSVELGYGFSHDPNHSKYNNSGFLLNGDLFPLQRTPWTFWSINGSIAQWFTNTPVNKNLTAGALSLALRVYPYTFGDNYQSYILGTVGPAYLSNHEFGYNNQGSNFSIQTNIGLGAEFHCIDVNLRLAHFSNAGLGTPNEGFNILYMLSLGYLF